VQRKKGRTGEPAAAVKAERAAEAAAEVAAAEAAQAAIPPALRGAGPPGTMYHAHTCLPIEPPLPGDEIRDSDDDEDIEAWAREDFRHLSGFDDVVKTEKAFMHDWNVFMHKYRPYADREVPAAYEAFAHYRGGAVTHVQSVSGMTTP
jgi:hypothetical protein